MDLRVPLSRDQLNALTMDLVDRTFQICDRVLEEKGIRRNETDEVILVGGQSRIQRRRVAGVAPIRLGRRYEKRAAALSRLPRGQPGTRARKLTFPYQIPVGATHTGVKSVIS